MNLKHISLFFCHIKILYILSIIGTIFQNALMIYGVYNVYKTIRPYLTLDNLLNVVPGAANAVEKTLQDEVTKTVNDMFHPLVPKEEQVLRMPKSGGNYDIILKEMARLREFDASGNGKHFAYIYDPCEPDFSQFVSDAFNLFRHENGLNPTAFPALRKFEVDVVQMAASLFHGPTSVVGTMTSGGTESILCALKAYRQRARDLWPHITKPEIVIPVTGHVAFPKAGDLFDLTLRFIPLNEDCTVNMEKYASAINDNTILLVGSAPQYPHGLVDPIENIASLCQYKNRIIPLHVDACVGGFILPFLERLGEPIPKWDYRIAEVTSISADVHKYGYAPKGASTLTFRDSSYRKYQFWVFTTWPGGLFTSPSLLGTRGGGPIAAAWAALIGLGIDGFTKIASRILDTRRRFINGITSVPSLKIIGNPIGPIIAFRSIDKNVNVLAVADRLESRGWSLERQQLPSCCHMTIMPSHADKVEIFCNDLIECVEEVQSNPELNKQGSAAMYGMVASIPSTTIVDKFLLEFQNQLLSVDKYENEVAKIPPPTARGGHGSIEIAIAGMKKENTTSNILHGNHYQDDDDDVEEKIDTMHH